MPLQVEDSATGLWLKVILLQNLFDLLILLVRGAMEK